MEPHILEPHGAFEIRLVDEGAFGRENNIYEIVERDTRTPKRVALTGAEISALVQWWASQA